MRVLIIENDTELGKTLSNTLQEVAYQCDIAENISDAKYYLDIRNYDLVLLDWKKDASTKLSLIAEIKKDAADQLQK
ncbi:MAG: hypothetical protein DSZ12_06490 [Sulfurovum sp.]|nr:MAG: hypothetical protein DSZ12_06490 [Sulfurovum sp.]